MIDRIWKIALTAGVAAGVCAILLSIFSGTHLHWSTSESGGNIDIRIGTGSGWSTGFLGSLAIVCLLLGGAAFAATRPSGASAGGASFLTFLQKLTKSDADCWLGGVCGGLGVHSPVPSWVWRLIFLVLAFALGTGVAAYVILWICLPDDRPAGNPPAEAPKP